NAPNAWLVHQLGGLHRNGKPAFDTIIVVTDRRLLTKQLSQTIGQFAQVKATIGYAKSGSDELRRFIEEGKKIIISTVQKFPYILDEIGDQHRDRTFAIVIDEAHSSQGGKNTTAMTRALGARSESEVGEAPEPTIEDLINREMESRKLLDNASYFAFTATPKNKTLEIFGSPEPDGRSRPFHLYSMKQAIEEGFIMDVLEKYTPVKSYYRLVKTVEHDPQFDEKKAHARLRRFVEKDERAIRAKAEIMVDHFLERVIGERKVGGKARAMVVASSVEQAINYWRAINDYLKELNSPYRAIVAFAGERDFGAGPVTEASLNGFPSNEIEDRIREDPYRLLVCAEKFQTGYDEPLLHTMYVDKPLSDIKAVQTLSRLNRVLPEKRDTFVLDFYNDVDTIQSAFERYYTTTILSGKTDPNKLHDLVAELEKHQVFTDEQVETVCSVFLTGGNRTELDPVLDVCVGEYVDLDEEHQVEFKSAAKTFLRTYNFLASILPYNNAEWEKLSIFLNLLVPKLPAPKDQDFAEGITAFVDLDSYRAEKQQTRRISLSEDAGEIDPVPVGSGAGGPSQLELDFLSNIIREFNDIFGNIQWSDEDRVRRLITEDIPNRVAADEAFQNALQHSGEQNARIEGHSALQRVMGSMVQDDVQLYRQFKDNPDFASWLAETVFLLASRLGQELPTPG
ncbi:MAG UNVERIFIED_CONTAM: DEAD/DEAH box helicase family protein, partial [Thermobifida fusca]